MTNDSTENRIELSTVNMSALRMTIETLLGDYGVFEKAYIAIDKAMAYGLNAARADTDRMVKEADDAGQRGVAQAARLADIRYNEGYCEGVRDARRRPGIADGRVQGFIESADYSELVNAVAAMEDECVIPRDSGDENDFDQDVVLGRRS